MMYSLLKALGTAYLAYGVGMDSLSDFMRIMLVLILVLETGEFLCEAGQDWCRARDKTNNWRRRRG